MTRLKTERVSLRFSHSEKEKLSSKAAEARMSMSQYLLALSEQKKIIVVDELPELIRQIIKIGTNVNQIAMVANTHKSVSQKQIETVESQLSDIQNLLGNLIDVIKNSKDEIEV
ncbi:MAG: plasmid mobilization relaxosome protein MobC [Ruminococcus sp.]|nr:plasmid mobilization relaxosome protein MobC [Ruminococcus sp.]